MFARKFGPGQAEPWRDSSFVAQLLCRHNAKNDKWSLTKHHTRTCGPPSSLYSRHTWASFTIYEYCNRPHYRRSRSVDAATMPRLSRVDEKWRYLIKASLNWEESPLIGSLEENVVPIIHASSLGVPRYCCCLSQFSPLSQRFLQPSLRNSLSNWPGTNDGFVQGLDWINM